VMIIQRPIVSAVFVLSATISATAVHASNAELQDFFFDACVNPTAGLAARCAQTTGGLGDLSGDSESSLNPSQTLSSSDAAIHAAQQRGQELRERLQRGGVDTADKEGLSLGPFSLLVNARHVSFEADRQVDADAERSYDGTQRTAELGLDYRVNENLVVGGWLHWESAEQSFDREAAGVGFTPFVSEAGSQDSTNTGFTVYASTGLSEQIYLDASIGYTKLDTDFARFSIFQESTRTADQTNVVTTGNTDGDRLSATLNLGISLESKGWQLSPFAGFTYVKTDFDDYVETDRSASGLNLAVRGAQRSTLIGQAGFRVSKAISMQGWVLLPQARVEYVHGFSTERAHSSVRFVNDLNANQFVLRGDNPDAGRVDFAFGVMALLPNGWMTYLEYQSTASAGDFDRYQIAAGLRVEL